MGTHVRLLRLFLLLLAIVTLGRWLQSELFHTPYDKGHHVFSIVILTAFAAIFYAAFCRRWLGYRLLQAAGLGLVLGLVSQVVILVSTVASYALGISSYFNHPTALNVTEAVPFAEAMKLRLGGLLGNTIMAGIAAALGWVFGGTLPESKSPPRSA